jgi:hypothetical protein
MRSVPGRPPIPPRRCAALGALALALAGCFGEEVTAFPEGLEPLEASRAPSPVAPGEPWKESVALVSGETDEFGWVHARGHVLADLPTTWAALRTPEATIDRRQVDEWTVVRDTEPEYAFSHAVDHVVRSIVTVRYRVNWRSGPVEGSVEAPEVVAARFQKTDGSVLISILRGSVVAREVAPGVTELEVVEHLSTAQGGTERIETYLRDLFASVRARARGEPLPTYD